MKGKSCFILAVLLAVVFVASSLLCSVSALADGNEIDEVAVYQAQIISRANALYRKLTYSHDAFTSFISLTQRDLASYESTLRQANLYNEYKDEMIGYTEAFCEVFISFLKSDPRGMITTAAGKLMDEGLKGVLPNATVDQFIYAQAKSGGDWVTISRLWDAYENYRKNEDGFTSYDEACDFMLAVQGNKMGMAALKMGKAFYMNQLSESPWSLAAGIAKDLLVSQIMGLLPEVDWLLEYGAGHAANTLLDGIITLGTESNNRFIQEWESEIETIKSETEYLFRLDTTDPALYPEHTVFFDPQGGAVQIESMPVHETCPYGMMPRPYLFGYGFDGWYDQPEGGELYTSSSKYALETDQMLYAHWTHTVLEQGSCGPDMQWTLFGDYILEITGTGRMTEAPWLTKWAALIRQVNLPSGLTSICCSAFADTPCLKTIDIPNNVTEIGAYAFGFSGLQSLQLPSRLVSLGQGILFGNTGVKELTFPASLNETGYAVYSDINAPTFVLQSETTSQGYVRIDYRIRGMHFGVLTKSAVEQVTFQTGTTVIPAGICSNASKLNQVNLPTGVREIGAKSFAGCPLLTTISLPDTVVRIGHDAFGREYGPTPAVPRSAAATSVVIVVEDSWLGEESGLESLTLPSRVQHLGDGILMGNTKVTSLSIPGTVVSASRVTRKSEISQVTIRSGMTVIPSEMLKDGEKLTSLELPDGLLEIGDEAFANTGLTFLSLPDGVQKLGSGILWGSSVYDLTLPASVTQLVYGPGSPADNQPMHTLAGLASLTLAEGWSSVPDRFAYGLQLNQVTLPATVQSIGAEAFRNCDWLWRLNYTPATLPTIGEKAFAGTNLTPMLLVPETIQVNLEPEDGSKTLALKPYLISNEEDPYQALMEQGGFQWTIGDETVVQGIAEGNLTFCGIGTAQVTCRMGSVEAYFTVIARLTRKLVLPKDLVEIDEEAFAGLKVERVILPDGVQKIGVGAFRNCGELMEINMPDSILEIAENAFNGCPNVTLYCASENDAWRWANAHSIHAEIEKP